jgi:hypothetical protein
MQSNSTPIALPVLALAENAISTAIVLEDVPYLIPLAMVLSVLALVVTLMTLLTGNVLSLLVPLTIISTTKHQQL